MVMILQFKDKMDKLNQFFRKVYSSPLVMWNGTAAVIFLVIGLTVMLVPSVMGADATIRFGFGSMLTIYGLFRLWTFYKSVNTRDDA